jgi:serine phosphatase RsbU (regulator of sigma subunit)
LDYRALFSVVPTACVVLDTNFVVQDCNSAYAEVVGRPRTDLVGRGLFELFPDVTSPVNAAGNAILEALTTAVRTGRPARLGMLRYDIAATGGAVAGPRFWVSTVVPVPATAGQVTSLLYNVHDVSAFALGLSAAAADGQPGGLLHQASVLSEVVSVTEQSKLFDPSVEAERQLGIAVQSVMLPSDVPSALRGRVAVRYRPSSEALRVGGDWYDVADLGDGRLAMAVGDVVGHGLRAAAMMGQLRSALRALILADIGPAGAMVALDRVARQSDEATSCTSVKIVIDPELDLLTYSSAGHLPPVLVRSDGAVELLDQATGPPLAVTEWVDSRPLGTARVRRGDTLVLYTDGLVERRDEDVDVGIGRLAACVARHRHRDVESLADQLLDDLRPSSALQDDIALVVLRM